VIGVGPQLPMESHAVAVYWRPAQHHVSRIRTSLGFSEGANASRSKF